MSFSLRIQKWKSLRRILRLLTCPLQIWILVLCLSVCQKESRCTYFQITSPGRVDFWICSMTQLVCGFIRLLNINYLTRIKLFRPSLKVSFWACWYRFKIQFSIVHAVLHFLSKNQFRKEAHLCLYHSLFWPSVIHRYESHIDLWSVRILPLLQFSITIPFLILTELIQICQYI